MIIKELSFNTYEELAKYHYELLDKVGYVVSILYYDEAKALMEVLIREHNLEINSIELDNPKFGGYNDEYYVSLTDEGVLDIEKVYRDGQLIFAEGEITLVDGRVPYKLIKSMPIDSIIYELDIDDIHKAGDEVHWYGSPDTYNATMYITP